MADSTTAIQKTIANEGGYVDNPHDTGGPTKYGITQADMPGADIQSITEEQAATYYSEHYWKPLYSEINDQTLAEKLFDMGVLFGVKVAVTLLQISLSYGITVVPDGVFGPNTLAATNERGNIQNYKVVLLNHCMEVVNRNRETLCF